MYCICIAVISSAWPTGWPQCKGSMADSRDFHEINTFLYDLGQQADFGFEIYI